MRRMKPKDLYLTLAIVGALLPLSQLVLFLVDHGLDARLFVQQLFATPISRFFGFDVFVSALVSWVLVSVEGRRASIRQRWAPLLATVLVGVSLGLPLFLYLREVQLEQGA
jgi:hypothetical protein